MSAYLNPAVHAGAGAYPLEIASWAGSNLTGSPANHIDMAYPSGIEADDLLLMILNNNNSQNAGSILDIVTPSGWTEDGYFGTTATDTHTLVCHKIATGSESGTIAVGNTDFPGNVYSYYGWILRIHGHDPTTPVHKILLNNNGVNGTTHPQGPVTTTVDGCLILMGQQLKHGGGEPFTFQSPYAKIDELNSIDTTSSWRSGGIAQTIQASAGSTGTPNCYTSASQRGNSMMVAIAPAP